MRVYMDHGATTPVDLEVAKEVKKYLVKCFGNASSLHSFGTGAKEALENFRKIVASAIGAESHELIFTSGGTESDNLAIKGVAFAQKQKSPKKNHIIISKIEHSAVLETCRSLEKQGFEVSYLGVDNEGFVRLSELKKAITQKTFLVSIMHANNEIGTIEPVEEIGKLCREMGVLFHTDAVQSFTKVPIDVKKMNIDLLSLSAHKIHGPKGVGALYVRKGVKIKAQSDGGGHEFKLRAGTENIPGIAGFAKAVQLCKPEHVLHMRKLRDYMTKRILKEIPNTMLNGPKGDKRLVNNVNISFENVEGEAILLRLDAKGVAVSTGSACSSKSLKPSHVLMAVGRKEVEAHGSIRFTLGRENTMEEVDYVIRQTKKVISDLRAFSPLARQKPRRRG